MNNMERGGDSWVLPLEGQAMPDDLHKVQIEIENNEEYLKS